MAACPNCHAQAMPDKEKLRVGALRDHRCPHCGTRLRLHPAGLGSLVLLWSIFAVASRHLEFWPAMGLLFGLFVLQWLVVIRFVPLLERTPAA